MVRDAVRLVSCLVLALLLSACGEDPRLLLRLRTDLVAEADYSEARVVVSGVSPSVRDVTMPLTRAVSRDEGRDVALGEVGPLPAGDYRVEVELWTDFGSRVAVNQVLVQVQGLAVVTVPITADCIGLTCPSRGDAPDATFCLGGTCVPEVCRENRAAAGCPAAECAVDTDCSSPVACAEARCVEGVCAAEPNDDLCMADEICSARLGCLPIDSGTECTPGSCDDFNPCTDDVCEDAGCVFTPNAATCDDGVFCNGADTCAAGLCDGNSGDPCGALGACQEATRSCGAGTCGADERVLSGSCVACPAGTGNDPGDDPTGSDTSCTAIFCAADQRVLSNTCFPCPAGASNAPGDDASGPDTTCVVNACEVDRRVVSNACIPCPAGETNPAGDDPTGPDTTCMADVCSADFRVVSNACVPCPAGETNEAGDLANGPDTGCTAVVCLANFRVMSNACVPCGVGQTNGAGDVATGPDTSCDCVESIRTDTFDPSAQWYARGNAFDAGGARVFGDTDFYRNTSPARAMLSVAGTTQLVINEFLNNLYWREFSRPIEPEGLSFWIGQFESGGSFEGIRSSILAGASGETAARVEQSCGTTITNGCSVEIRTDGGAPFARCSAGRVYARDSSGAGAAPHETGEYYIETAMPGRIARDATTYGELNEFIDGVYEGEFGRPVDCAGLDFWAGVYVANPTWDFTRLRTELIAAGSSELEPCGGATRDCVDFTLDTCGAEL
ncbi:MAG: hypothetical protein AB8I08_01770 [Sandaracinaceae bacterium]